MGVVAVGAAAAGAATVGVVTVGAATVGVVTVGAATVGVVTVGAATVGVIAVGAATVGAVTVGVVTVGAATTTGAMTMATPLAAPGLTTATCPAKLIAGIILTTHQGSNLYSLIMFSNPTRTVVSKNSN
jgi:deleted-in-malignant-brain-tumors protein 1